MGTYAGDHGGLRDGLDARLDVSSMRTLTESAHVGTLAVYTGWHSELSG